MRGKGKGNGECLWCAGYCSLDLCSPRCAAMYQDAGQPKCRECGAPQTDYVHMLCGKCSRAAYVRMGVDPDEARKDYDSEGRYIPTSDYHKDRS